jgi:hypothetical protein
MRPRHLLGVAIFWGVVGTLGGQTAQAATPNSPKFIKLLLMNQTKAIKADNKLLNMRDTDAAKLEATTNPRVERMLEKTLTTLHNQILSMTTRLIVEATQIYTGANVLSPPNPPLKSEALANLLATQVLSRRAGLGIQPATPTQ